MSTQPILLIVCDTEGVVQQVNVALDQLTGKPESEFLGRHLNEIFSPDSTVALEKFPEKLGSESLVDCEINLRCADELRRHWR